MALKLPWMGAAMRWAWARPAKAAGTEAAYSLKMFAEHSVMPLLP